MSLVGRPKKASLVVVDSPSSKLGRLAEGKLDLMTGIRADTDDGKEIRQFLLELMRTSDKDSVRLKAATLLLEYGFGKPVEISVSAKVDSGTGGTSELSDKQLEAMISGEEDAEIEE